MTPLKLDNKPVVFPNGEIFLQLEGSNWSNVPTAREIKWAIWGAF